MYNLTYEKSLSTIYTNSSLLPLILLSMINQKHTPKTKNYIKDSYDYIVVGAGSAGSVVAGRLAEEKCVSVLLLEAGKSPPKIVDIPAISLQFWHSEIDWGYLTVPQKYTAANLINRTVYWPGGKVIGGTGNLNGMLYNRGNYGKYDEWASKGAVGWDAHSLMHYFKKLENETNPEFAKQSYHGTHGPVTISDIPYTSPLKKAILKTAKQMGYYFGDISGSKQSGFYAIQNFMRHGQRCNSAKAYLVPKDHQSNFDIVSEAFVRKIIIENKVARGVEIDFQGQTRRINALKEVIISAGTVRTPQILMLSGIGPKQELEKHKIEVIQDLPVGKNLLDQVGVFLPFDLNPNISSFSEELLNPNDIKTYIKYKTGPMTVSPGTVAVAFLKRDGTEAEKGYPEVEHYFLIGPAQNIARFNVKPEFYEAYYKPYENKSIFWCVTQNLYPKTSGEITLRSNDPYDKPIIDPNYLADPEDVNLIAQGMKTCKRIGLSEPLKNIGSKLFPLPYPGCEKYIKNEHEYFKCQVRSEISTYGHFCGTSKMGDPMDPSTVVDPKLRVKGISNLRVVDASIIPSLPSGNTYIPTLMIGEKGADLIKENIHCEYQKQLKK